MRLIYHPPIILSLQPPTFPFYFVFLLNIFYVFVEVVTSTSKSKCQLVIVWFIYCWISCQESHNKLLKIFFFLLLKIFKWFNDIYMHLSWEVRLYNYAICKQVLMLFLWEWRHPCIFACCYANAQENVAKMDWDDANISLCTLGLLDVC